MEIFKPKKQERVSLNKTSIGICLIIILQIYQITNNYVINYRIKKDPSIQIGETPEEFCAYVLKSVIDEEISWKMFDEQTYKSLKAEPDYFSFKNEERIKFVKIKEDQCRVTTESSTGELRGFLIVLTKDIKNPFYYKALTIEEDEAPGYALAK